MKTMILCVSMTWFKIYFKSRTGVFSNVHVTNNYILRLKEDLGHALTVGKSFLHLTLSTVVFNRGKTLSFQATGYKTTGQIRLFLIPKRG
jgi:hypothetical protein